MSLSVDTLKARTAGSAVTTTEGLNVGGACTATSFVGDGSSITGIANTGFINATQLNVIGVATASSFVGNVTGNASGLTGTPDITVRNITGVAATFTGVLTYEDVTNVDSVGIVTARGGLEVGAAGVGATITSAGNAIISGITTLGDDVVFTGATANVTWDKSEDDLVFPDDARAKFGTGLDLHIYHNGSNSVIREEGTGNLNIQTTGGNVDILVNTTETAAKFISEGAVELYNSNAKKLETLSTGVKVTGITSTTQLTVGPGLLQESFDAYSSALNSIVNHDVLDHGMVLHATTNASASFTINLRGDGSTTFNSLMNIGQTTVFTVYSASNNTSYYLSNFQIDGSGITEKWSGGSAPSAGTGSGVDVYTFNILKTANATFSIYANTVNFA